LKETIHIVIITYNNKELLKRCISSVLNSLQNSGLGGKVYVVDNASTDGTEELLTTNFSSVCYRINKQNLGLSKSLNIGIREGLSSTYVLLLNDDVELFPETISLMEDTLKKYPMAKGIPAALMYPDGRYQRVKLKIMGVQKKALNTIQYVKFAGTTACMYKTETFKELGLFDEFYFFYNEDLDFSLKAKRKGVKFVFNPEIKVIHHRKKGRIKAEKSIKPYFYATNYYFYRKNYGRLTGFLYQIVAFFHIVYWEKRFIRENEKDKLLLLRHGRNKLRETVRNFANLSCEKNVI
jgi:GT2 family glycosyltransferase